MKIIRFSDIHQNIIYIRPEQIQSITFAASGWKNLNVGKPAIYINLINTNKEIIHILPEGFLLPQQLQYIEVLFGFEINMRAEEFLKDLEGKK